MTPFGGWEKSLKRLGLIYENIVVFSPPGYKETPALRQAVLDQGFIMMLENRLTLYCKDLIVTDQNTYPYEAPDAPGLIKAIRLVNIGGDYCPPAEAFKIIDKVASHRGLFIPIVHAVHQGQNVLNDDNYPNLEKILGYIHEHYVLQGKPVWYGFTSEIAKCFNNRENTEIRLFFDNSAHSIKIKLSPKIGLGNSSKFFEDIPLTIWISRPQDFAGIGSGKLQFPNGVEQNIIGNIVIRKNFIVVPNLPQRAYVEIQYVSRR